MNKNRLMVLIDGRWKYVFCHSPVQGLITTENRNKALGRDALEYFKSKYGNHEFRICTGLKCCHCKEVFIPNEMQLCRECGYLY